MSTGNDWPTATQNGSLLATDHHQRLHRNPRIPRRSHRLWMEPLIEGRGRGVDRSLLDTSSDTLCVCAKAGAEVLHKIVSAHVGIDDATVDVENAHGFVGRKEPFREKLRLSTKTSGNGVRSS